jgi:hypothetical protein
VLVNRVWLKLMGRGLVTTPDNFGMMGMAPSHPELLDHLAVSLMDDGWSVKRLIRRVVTSRAYALSSVHDATNERLDPDNVLRWRMDRRRLDAEAIRDAMLAVSGTLDERPLAGSLVARVQENQLGLVQLLGGLRSDTFRHRSIYLPIIRDQIPEFLSVFDFPDASLVSGSRDATNVPSQVLFLLNNREPVALAEAFADRVARLDGDVAERFWRGRPGRRNGRPCAASTTSLPPAPRCGPGPGRAATRSAARWSPHARRSSRAPSFVPSTDHRFSTTWYRSTGC